MSMTQAKNKNQELLYVITLEKVVKIGINAKNRDKLCPDSGLGTPV